MRVISLLQPWASLWLAGAPIGKGIETRSWGTKYRGVVAVHASKTMDEETLKLCYTSPFREALTSLGFDTASQLPLGKVLGTVVLTGCLRMSQTYTQEIVNRHHQDATISVIDDPRLTVRERAFGNYAPGRYAWITAPDPRVRLADPIPMRGSQGLRKLVPEIAERIARADTVPAAPRRSA
jgi:hypothetical protein